MMTLMPRWWAFSSAIRSGVQCVEMITFALNSEFFTNCDRVLHRRAKSESPWLIPISGLSHNGNLDRLDLLSDLGITIKRDDQSNPAANRSNKFQLHKLNYY